MGVIRCFAVLPETGTTAALARTHFNREWRTLPAEGKVALKILMPPASLIHQ